MVVQYNVHVPADGGAARHYMPSMLPAVGESLWYRWVPHSCGAVGPSAISLGTHSIPAKSHGTLHPINYIYTHIIMCIRALVVLLLPHVLVVHVHVW